jgi:hypothetical protein
VQGGAHQNGQPFLPQNPQDLKVKLQALKEAKRDDLMKSLLVILVIVAIVLGLLWAGHAFLALIVFCLGLAGSSV